MEQKKAKEYLIPEKLEEVLELLADRQNELCIVAGATDVYVGENNGVNGYLDISKTGLAYIDETENYIALGACTTFDEIIRSELMKKEAGCLWMAAKQLADKTIRNVATVGGNVCNAVPSGDAISPLVALDAEFVMISKNGERKMKAEDFFVGVRKIQLKSDEILKEIQIPRKEKLQSSVFMKQGRNSEDIAIVNVAVNLLLDENGKVSDIRIANGAVAPTVVRATELEKSLIGESLNEQCIDENIDKIEKSISPITNVRGTAEYRMDISKVYTKRSILQAYNEIKEK